MFSGISPVFVLLTSLAAGYIFGTFRFPRHNVLFMLVLATAIVPFEISMVPLFLQMNALHLVNTPLGLVLPNMVLSYGIFLSAETRSRAFRTSCSTRAGSTG